MKTDIQELLTTSAGTEGSLLIPKTIYANLIEAVEKKRIGRQFAAIYLGPNAIKGSSVDINTVDPDSMNVRQVAEGAGIPIDTATYSSFNMKPVKYGVRPVVTKEMQEDGMWDLITHNLKVAGSEMAENEDSLIVTDALDNATNTQAQTGENVTIADITRAIQYLEDSDYSGTTLFVGPEVAYDIRNIDTFVEADKSGNREMMDSGFIGRMYGMDVYRVSGNIMTTTVAYVFDKDHAFVIAEKRPITVEKYDDVTHDLSGIVVTQRIKVRQLRADAICKITSI
jgi:HK97 family phage major capsid protein